MNVVRCDREHHWKGKIVTNTKPITARQGKLDTRSIGTSSSISSGIIGQNLLLKKRAYV